jgi:hypothetical protein
MKFQRLENKVLRAFSNFSKRTLVRNRKWILNYRTDMVVSQNYAGKKKSYKIMTMKIFATQDKAKPDTKKF